MRIVSLLLLAASALPCTAALAQKQSDWTGTWAAAAMPLPASTKLPLGTADMTVRQVVHISQGGKRLRIVFTNEFGTTPLRISAAHVAFLSVGSKILKDTDRTLTFNGQPGITIAPGAFAASDGVDGTVPIFADVVITTAIPAQPLPVITQHALGLTTTWVAPGSDVAAEQFESPLSTPPQVQPPDVAAPVRSLHQGEKPTAEPILKASPAPEVHRNGSLVKTSSWYFLKRVEVDRNKRSKSVVAIGDSITDGARSTPETNRRWPDVLAGLFTTPGPLLRKNPPTVTYSMLNVGISGNRVLKTGTGPSALDRLDRDVLSQPDAKFVVLLEGINDIGNMHRAPADAITEQEMLDAYTTISKKVHAAGMKLIIGTLTPYEGAKYYSEDGEQIREHLNAFFRTSKLFDGVIDFDKVIADPQHPLRFNPKYDSGDHLHPSDAGYAAMAAGVDLKLFKK